MFWCGVVAWGFLRLLSWLCLGRILATANKPILSSPLHATCTDLDPITAQNKDTAFLTHSDQPLCSVSFLFNSFHHAPKDSLLNQLIMSSMWESHKQTIYSLYLAENMPLKQVIAKITETHDFSATYAFHVTTCRIHVPTNLLLDRQAQYELQLKK